VRFFFYLQNRNLNFDELEKRFSCLIRSVQGFSSDAQRFRDQVCSTHFSTIRLKLRSTIIPRCVQSGISSREFLIQLRTWRNNYILNTLLKNVFTWLRAKEPWIIRFENSGIRINSCATFCIINDIVIKYSLLWLGICYLILSFIFSQLHETVVSQYNIAETVADLYKDRVHTREVERFRSAHKKVISTVWHEFVSQIIF